jgi:NodT family efflux transporter outer membrane factor (OMF) lipoprotein
MNMSDTSRAFVNPLMVMIGTLILSACTTVGPDFERPDTTVADDWLEAEDARVDAENVEYSDWWEVFQDPVLSQLIDLSYKQNLGLQVAGLRILEARAQLGFATGLQYPQSQSVSAGYARSRASENAPPLSSLPDDVSSRASQGSNTWSMGFDAAWEADIWGKFERGIQAADANLAANMLNYDALLVTLTGDIAGLYASVRTFEERLAVARQNVALQEAALDLAQTRFKLGASSQLDVEQSTALLRNTQALIPSLELGLGRTRNILSFLLGMPPSDMQSILGESGNIPVAPTTAAVGIPADLLRRRPDVRAAEMAAATQSAAIGVSQADLYPHFVIAGSIGVAGETFSDQFESGSGNGYIAPFISWDIFNYGRIKNNVRVQDARFEQLAVAYQNSVLNAAREVQDGLLGFLRTQERVGYLTDAVDASQRAAELALIQYRQGAIDYTRVLDTQTALLQQQDALTTSRGEIVINLVSVYKALGGGWQLRQGNNYVDAEIRKKMSERTDWDELLESTAVPAQGELD